MVDVSFLGDHFGLVNAFDGLQSILGVRQEVKVLVREQVRLQGPACQLLAGLRIKAAVARPLDCRRHLLAAQRLLDLPLDHHPRRRVASQVGLAVLVPAGEHRPTHCLVHELVPNQPILSYPKGLDHRFIVKSQELGSRLPHREGVGVQSVSDLIVCQVPVPQHQESRWDQRYVRDCLPSIHELQMDSE